MPEIFRADIKNGFISIWKPEEELIFFKYSVEIDHLKTIEQNFEQTKRLKEKLVPHHILKQFDPGLILTYDERKPIVNCGHVSISHCANYIALAFTTNSTQGIGIDIETYGDRILKIQHKFLSQEELDFCNKNSLKSLIIWSAKEAIFKKYGEGTAFFKENIFIEPFLELPKQELNARIKLPTTIVEEKLSCELFADFVMVHTN